MLQLPSVFDNLGLVEQVKDPQRVTTVSQLSQVHIINATVTTYQPPVCSTSWSLFGLKYIGFGFENVSYVSDSSNIKRMDTWKIVFIR